MLSLSSKRIWFPGSHGSGGINDYHASATFHFHDSFLIFATWSTSFACLLPAYGYEPREFRAQRLPEWIGMPENWIAQLIGLATLSDKPQDLTCQSIGSPRQGIG